MKSLQKGFTLIELMIVIAIIAILAAIAVPMYQNYLIKAQVSEGASLSGGAKTGVETFYSERGHFPHDNSSTGIALAGSITGSYVNSVAVDDGLITITYSNASPYKANDKINNKILVLSPATHAGSISWTCNPSNATGSANFVDSKYLPTSCR